MVHVDMYVNGARRSVRDVVNGSKKVIASAVKLLRLHERIQIASRHAGGRPVSGLSLLGLWWHDKGADMTNNPNFRWQYGFVLYIKHSAHA